MVNYNKQKLKDAVWSLNQHLIYLSWFFGNKRFRWNTLWSWGGWDHQRPILRRAKTYFEGPLVLMSFFLTLTIYHSEVIYEPVGGDIFDQCVRASQESNSQIFQKLVGLSFQLKASIGRTHVFFVVVIFTLIRSSTCVSTKNAQHKCLKKTMNTIIIYNYKNNRINPINWSIAVSKPRFCNPNNDLTHQAVRGTQRLCATSGHRLRVGFTQNLSVWQCSNIEISMVFDGFWYF